MIKRNKQGQFLKGATSPRKGGRLTEAEKRKVSEKTKEAMAKLSPKKKEAMRQAGIGREPWNKGTRGVMKANASSIKKGQRLSPETEFTSERVKGEKNNKWKGDKVGYFGLHTWVQREKGKAKKCKWCSSEDKIEWANKSREYKRNLNDWVPLCHKCHAKYDRNGRRVVAISGASRGIGLAIKKSLEKEGHKIISYSRTEGIDLMDEIPILPEISILINNVGGMGRCTFEDSERCMQKNYGIMNKLIEQFLSQKPKWGRVITISSIFGKEKGRNQYFTAAKAAQIGYMKSLAGTVSGTTFNTVCPGYVDVDKVVPSFEESPIKPQDVANLVTFLCSDSAKFIDGATITVDGGISHSF